MNAQYFRLCVEARNLFQQGEDRGFPAGIGSLAEFSSQAGLDADRPR